MTDRLNEIRKHRAFMADCVHCGRDLLVEDDVTWLIDEVERLRWFEKQISERFSRREGRAHNDRFMVCAFCDSDSACYPGCEYVAHGGKR